MAATAQRQTGASVSASARTPQMVAALETLQNDVDRLRSSTAQDTIDSNRRLGSLKADISTVSGALNDHVASFSRQLDEVERRFNGLDQGMKTLNTNSEHLPGQLRALRQELDTVREILRPLDGRLRTIEDNLRTTEQLLNPLARRFPAVEAQLGPIGPKLNAIEGQLTRIDNQLGLIPERFTLVNGKLKSLDRKTSPLDGRLTEIENKLDLLGQRVGLELSQPIMQRFDLVDEKLASFRQHMDLDQRLAPLNQRFDHLERFVEEQMGQLRVEFRSR